MEEKSIWLSKKHCTSTTANTLNLPVCYEQNQRYETKNTGYFSLKIYPKKYHGKCRVSKVRCSTRACLKIALLKGVFLQIVGKHF